MRVRRRLLLLVVPLAAVAVAGHAAAAGEKPDEAFLDQWRGAVEAEARDSEFGRVLRPEFFETIGRDPELRDAALEAITRAGPKVAANLARLLSARAAEVRELPALAVAFAAAWAAGDDLEPRRVWVDGWLENGRDVPDMIASFSWYSGHEKDLRVSPRKTSWRVLAYLADTGVPLAEREWALERFGERTTPGLRGLFGAVPYTLSPKRDEPCTLESFLRIGGPCTHNVQFADGVFDSFGIPSGWSGGVGHTWPFWFEEDRGAVSFHRINDLGNRVGHLRDPLSKRYLEEYDLRLLAAAINESEPDRIAASAAAWAFRHASRDQAGAAAARLPAALHANPFCGDALDALAKAAHDGTLPPDAARTALREVLPRLSEHPDVLLRVLEAALPLPDGKGEGALLDGATKVCDRAGVRELADRVPFLRGRCREAAGDADGAVRVYEDHLKAVVDRDAGQFRRALEASLGVLAGPERARDRRRFLERVGKLTRPSHRGETPDARKKSRTIATLALVDDRREAGDRESADETWLGLLRDARAGNGDGTSAPAREIGGEGGSPFRDEGGAGRLVGLRVWLTGYSGRTIVTAVQAVFEGEGEDGDVAGPVRGRKAGQAHDLRAPEGWVVGGVAAAGSDRLDGLALLFVPRGSRDRPDAKLAFSEWLGSRREAAVLLGGTSDRRFAVVGRCGANVDRLGLEALK